MFGPLKKSLEELIAVSGQAASDIVTNISHAGTAALERISGTIPKKEEIRDAFKTLQLSNCGKFISPDGQLHEPHFPLPANLAFKKDEIHHNKTPIIFVNGINCDVGRASALAIELANKTNTPVCALYNQSINLGHDVLQAVTDKMNLTDKPVVKALCNLLCEAFYANTSIHIAAHSHGAVVVSKALSDSISILKRSGAKEKNLTWWLSRLTVETFGGAATRYPDGPSYIHYVDNRDKVAWYAGVARFGLNEFEIRLNETRVFKKGTTGIAAAATYSAAKLIEPGVGAKIYRVDSLQPNTSGPDFHALSNYLGIYSSPFS